MKLQQSKGDIQIQLVYRKSYNLNFETRMSFKELIIKLKIREISRKKKRTK